MSPPDPPAVFVYGTLMPGAEAWHLLAPHARGWVPVSVRARLLDTGFGYPAALFSPERVGEGAGPVPGFVVDLQPDRVDAVMVELDVYEDVPSGMYRRVVVTSECGRRAWAWEWMLGVEGMRVLDAWPPEGGRGRRYP